MISYRNLKNTPIHIGKDVLVAGNPRFDNLKALGKSAKSVSLSLTQDRFGDATRSPGSYPGCSLYPEIEKFENGEFHFSNAESRKFDALIRTTSGTFTGFRHFFRSKYE